MWPRSDEEVYLAIQHRSRSSSLEDDSSLSRTKRTVHSLNDEKNEDVPASLDSKDGESTTHRALVASRSSSF